MEWKNKITLKMLAYVSRSKDIFKFINSKHKMFWYLYKLLFEKKTENEAYLNSIVLFIFKSANDFNWMQCSYLASYNISNLIISLNAATLVYHTVLKLITATKKNPSLQVDDIIERYVLHLIKKLQLLWAICLYGVYSRCNNDTLSSKT